MSDDTATPPKLPEAEHLHGCPAPPERVEAYDLTRADGVIVHVVRCITCGGDAYYPEEDPDGR